MSTSLRFGCDLSNIDIWSTFSTWKRSLLLSAVMTSERCLSMEGDLRTESSASIWPASEMVEMGVLNSWVMLLMKSFFISVIRFWRKARMMV